MKPIDPKRLHFGGPWVSDEDQEIGPAAPGQTQKPTVLFFLGDEFVLVTHLTFDNEKLEKIDFSSFTYDLGPGWMEWIDNQEGGPITKTLKWRVVKRRLEIYERGVWLSFIPTTIEILEKIGVPREYFQSWIDTFENEMKTFVLLRPTVPDFGPER